VLLVDPLPSATTGLVGEGNLLFSAGNEEFPSGSEPDADRANAWFALRNWISRGNGLVLVTSEPGSLPKELFRHVLRVPVPVAIAAHKPLEDEESGATESIALGDRRLSVNALGPRWKDVPAAWETAGDRRGSVYHRIPLGKGAVVVLLDDLAFSNQGLDFAANPDAIHGLVQREFHGGRIAMDEARHGHGRVRSYLTYLLALPNAKAVLALALLLAGMALYGQNVRLGKPEPFDRGERRTAREYVDALADLHERARAAPLMVEAVANRLQSLARRRASLTPEIEKVLEAASLYRAAAPREKRPLDALRLVQEMVTLRRKNFAP
jgi:hypothetical protein